jgi:hypothetical protein
MPGAVALAGGEEALASAAPELAGGWGSIWAGAPARPRARRARGAGRASLGVLLRRLRRELDPIPEHSQVSFCAPPAPAPRAFNNSWSSSPIAEEADARAARRGAQHRRMAAVQQVKLHLEDARKLEAGGAQDTLGELIHMLFLVLVVLLMTGCAACSFQGVQQAVVK